MSLEIIITSIQSLIDQQIEIGLDPKFTVAQVQRRANNLTRGNTVPSPTDIIDALSRFPIIATQGQRLVPVIIEEGKLNPGQISNLTRTGNPKNGTRYRRCSTVIERNRPDQSWRKNSRAREIQLGNTAIGVSTIDEIQRVQDKTKSEARRIAQEKNSRRTNQRLIRDWDIQDPAQKTINRINQITTREGIANRPLLESVLKNASATNSPLNCIFIWGPPYSRQDPESIFIAGSPEQTTAKQIIDILTDPEIQVSFLPTLIYADYYGTHINGMPDNQIDMYGANLRKWCLQQGINFTTWSAIRNINRTEYKRIKDNVTISAQPNAKEIESARATQQRIGNYPSEESLYNLALDYKIERLTEGMLLGQGLKLSPNAPDILPIKIATAPSRVLNDDPYEPNVIRIYPEILRAPWNKER